MVACLIACVAPAGGQSRTGVLEGQVADTSGGLLAWAQIALRDPGTNHTRVTTSDKDGTFRFTDLPVGTYEVRVEYPGFTPYVHRRR